MWLEPFPETWHSPGTLRALKGLYAKAKSYPWSHIEVLQVLLFQWHIYSQVSVNSIRWFICKAPEKAIVLWHRSWELPRSEQGSSNPHSCGQRKPSQNREKKQRGQIKMISENNVHSSDFDSTKRKTLLRVIVTSIKFKEYFKLF